MSQPDTRQIAKPTLRASQIATRTPPSLAFFIGAVVPFRMASISINWPILNFWPAVSVLVLSSTLRWR
jgi:hypothetical protein